MMTIAKDKRYAMKRAQEAYALAKAFDETNKAIDLEARQEELNAFDYPFKADARRHEPGEFCKDPKADFLIDEKYWDEYFHAIYTRRIAKGWRCSYKIKDAPEYFVTADAESFPLLKLAENVLIDCVLETVPEYLAKDLVKARDMYQERNELINIAMRWNTSK